MLDLQSKKLALLAALESAKLPEEDETEIKARAEIAGIQERLEAEKTKARNLDLDRRMDVIREKLGGDDAPILAVCPRGYPDTFIVSRNTVAHRIWQNAVADAAGKKGADREGIARAYAVSAVEDWNGVTAGSSEFTVKLTKYLTENLGLVTPLTDAAVELAGALAEERKS